LETPCSLHMTNPRCLGPPRPHPHPSPNSPTRGER
jgi:hypothetical protein